MHCRLTTGEGAEKFTRRVTETEELSELMRVRHECRAVFANEPVTAG